MHHLHKTAEGYQKAKETNPTHLGAFNKALSVLKSLVNAPTTAGMRDPSSLQAQLLAAQQQARPKRDNPPPGTYAAAVTGSTDAPTLPIGAKRPSSTPAPKANPSVTAIGAPKGASSKAKAPAGNVPIGTGSAAQEGTATQQDDGVTSETALEFLANAPPEHSFADYQAAQGAKPARDTQSGQSTPASRDSRGTRDKRAAQDAQSALSQSQPASQAPDASDRDLNEEDEIAMQQTLWQSRQQAQMQHADPTASSSAGGTAIQPKSIEEEVEEELARGQSFQEEASSIERLMCQRCLISIEVDRLRTLNQMITANKDRVVELCESRVRENQAKQARTSAVLASLRPLQTTKPKPADKPATPRADGPSAMLPPPVIVKHPPQTTQRGGTKAPSPVLDPPFPPPVNHPPTHQQPDGEQDSGQGQDPSGITFHATRAPCVVADGVQLDATYNCILLLL